jgi:Uma2 family endonuclease
MTQEEYLAAERQAETKSEYFVGEVYAMSGASEEHNLIVTNLIAALATQVRGGPCRVYPSDMRVKVEAGGLYTYPDVGVVCGKSRLEDEHFDTMLNPTVLIEVLSPSTEHWDKGQKAELYRRLSSLRELLLVAQDKPEVLRYHRQSERDWLLTEFRGLDQKVELPSIGCTLALADIYLHVFPQSESTR